MPPSSETSRIGWNVSLSTYATGLASFARAPTTYAMRPSKRPSDTSEVETPRRASALAYAPAAGERGAGRAGGPDERDRGRELGEAARSADPRVADGDVRPIGLRHVPSRELEPAAARDLHEEAGGDGELASAELHARRLRELLRVRALGLERALHLERREREARSASPPCARGCSRRGGCRRRRAARRRGGPRRRGGASSTGRLLHELAQQARDRGASARTPGSPSDTPAGLPRRTDPLRSGSRAAPPRARAPRARR